MKRSCKFDSISRRLQRGLGALVVGLALAAAAQTPLPAPPELSPLTTARQVLDLGLEVTRHLPHPVCVQGMVTYVESGMGTIYVQDQSGGLRVNYTNAILPRFGQSVMVQGVAVAGQVTPFIDCAEVRLLETSVAVEPLAFRGHASEPRCGRNGRGRSSEGNW